ncbi:7TM diverse intracellular signaling domain-containing protein [Coxiella burnetii]|uniref:7TM diverse intracellular signaling domain-containing protein n=1 Tax=Coxiella burnetii TaxID=777 RepID=UPI000163139C|nr:7TM diverse intracellular signaling domain-containing protein [Coxiella burnetii]ACJ20154.1 intracellular signalling protein [Coxiella burnetii CbuK_Q154]EAX33095.2 cyclase [Coxiella burnetii 'MSU Goat Q177']UYK68882.1 cyclase [Coxiella burnetii]
MQYKLVRLIGLLWLLLSITHAYAGTLVLTDDAKDEYRSMAPYMEMYLDSTHQLTLQDFLKYPEIYPFQKHDTNYIAKYINIIIWFRFSVDNQTDHFQSYYLTSGRGVDPGWTIYEITPNGDIFKHPQGLGEYHYSLFYISIPPHTKYQFYTSSYTVGVSLQNDFRLIRPRFELNVLNKSYFVIGVCYASVILLLPYSVILFLILRKKEYLIYALYIFSFLLGLAVLDGTINVIPYFVLSTPVYTYLAVLLAMLVAVFYGTFALVILKVKHFLPRIYRIIQAYLFGVILAFSLTLIDVRLTRQTVGVYILFIYLVFGVISLYLSFKKYTPAYYYLVGTLVLLVMTALGVLHELHVISFDIFFGQPTNFILSIEVVIHAFALSAFFNYVTKSKEAMEQRAIKANRTIIEEQQKAIEAQEKLLVSCSRFVPHEALEFLNIKTVDAMKSGAHVDKPSTVLFADIVNFTAMANVSDVPKTFQYINTYTSSSSPVIRQHDGFVVKYFGDAILALFGGAQASVAAIQSAIQMIHRLKKIKSTKQTDISIGVSITSGLAELGIAGSDDRMGIVLLGSPVNRATGFNSLTRLFRVAILITEPVYQEIKLSSQFHTRFLDQVSSIDKKKQINVYEVFDADEQTIIDKKVSIMPHYEAAIRDFNARKFKTALAQLKKCLSILPDDQASQIYLERCQKELKQ